MENEISKRVSLVKRRDEIKEQIRSLETEYNEIETYLENRRSMEHVLNQISKPLEIHYKCTMKDILLGKRKANESIARGVVFGFLQSLGYGYSNIGSYFDMTFNAVKYQVIKHGSKMSNSDYERRFNSFNQSINNVTNG